MISPKSSTSAWVRLDLIEVVWGLGADFGEISDLGVVA